MYYLVYLSPFFRTIQIKGQITINNRDLVLDQSLGGDMMYLKAILGLDGPTSNCPCIKCRKQKKLFPQKDQASAQMQKRSLEESSAYLSKNSSIN